MAQKYFCIAFLALFLGMTFSHPLTRDEINPENAEAGDDLLRVKKSPSPQDGGDLPLNAGGVTDDATTGQAKKDSVVLDLKDPAGKSGHPEGSQSNDKPPTPPMETKPSEAAPASDLLPPPQQQPPPPAAAAPAPEETKSAPEETKLAAEAERIEDKMEMNSRGDNFNNAPMQEDPQIMAMAVNPESVLQPYNLRSSRRKQAPGDRDSADPGYERYVEDDIEDDGPATRVITVDIPLPLAPGAAAAGSQASFYQMLGNMQGSQFMRGGRGSSYPQSNSNLPTDVSMLRQVLQQQSDMKQILIHIAEHQATLQDTLYRIETRIIQ